MVAADGTSPDAHVRGDARTVEPGAGFLRRQGVSRGDRILHHARQRRRVVGDHARRDEARRRLQPGHDAADRRGSAGSHRPRRDPPRRSPPRAPRSSTRSPATSRASSVGLPRAGLGRLRRATARADFEPDGRDARRRPASPLLHVRHDGEAEDGAAHARRATRSATSRRCTGSDCAKATCTGTSARPAGRSTPGAASSRRGTPAPPSSSSTTRASKPTRVLDALVAHRVTTLCAPPTVWRMLILEDLRACAYRAARDRRRRRAAEPGGHRARARRLGHHHPRRLRTDGDDGDVRQLTRPGGEGRIDGSSRCRATASRFSIPTAGRATTARSSWSSIRRRSA